MKLKLIDEWRSVWRFTSMWAAGAGFSVLVAWNMMPQAVRERVPDLVELVVGLLLWLLVMWCRATAQPTTNAKIAAKREASNA